MLPLRYTKLAARPGQRIDRALGLSRTVMPALNGVDIAIGPGEMLIVDVGQAPPPWDGMSKPWAI